MSNSESIECPLCLEAMDFDDVDFYPCPCRYQICRFCWYKIINEENGLCPACRKTYNSEHPAFFKPRTDEEIKNRIRHSKKVVPKKKPSNTDTKEYLSEYRVLQKNLIFVVGLPMRMADEIELLKSSEYFGKCGKVFKIVINQNQTFPGPQGSSCLSAYVTYFKTEEALRTLVDLKKLEIDGRAVKLSLGTTKYCSQFLKNRKCTKTDCMYLHEMGEAAASFTKDDMAGGRHTEYENQLIEEFIGSQQLLQQQQQQKKLASSVPLTSTSTSAASAINAKLQVSQNSSGKSMTLAETVANSSSSPSGTVHNYITPIGTNPLDPATKMYTSSSLMMSGDDKATGSSPSSNNNCSPNNENYASSNSSNPLLQYSTPNNPTSFNYQLNNTGMNHLNPSTQNMNSVASSNSASSGTPMSNLNFSSFTGNNSATNRISPTSDISSINQDADIDFDPIKVSRQALAELIANENRQNYLIRSATSNTPNSNQDFLSQSFSGMSLSGVGGNTSNHTNSVNSISQQQHQSISTSNINNVVNTNGGGIATSPPPPPPGFELTAALNSDEYMAAAYMPQQPYYSRFSTNQPIVSNSVLNNQSNSSPSAGNGDPVSSQQSSNHNFSHHSIFHPNQQASHLSYQNSYSGGNNSNTTNTPPEFQPTLEFTQFVSNQHHLGHHQSNSIYSHHPQSHHHQMQQHNHSYPLHHHLSQPQIIPSSTSPSSVSPTASSSNASVWKQHPQHHQQQFQQLHNNSVSTSYCDSNHHSGNSYFNINCQPSDHISTSRSSLSQHFSEMMRPNAYNRSLSMNDNSSGNFIRSADWNGFSHFNPNISFNSTITNVSTATTPTTSGVSLNSNCTPIGTNSNTVTPPITNSLSNNNNNGKDLSPLSSSAANKSQNTNNNNQTLQQNCH